MGGGWVSVGVGGAGERGVGQVVSTNGRGKKCSTAVGETRVLHCNPFSTNLPVHHLVPCSSQDLESWDAVRAAERKSFRIQRTRWPLLWVAGLFTKSMALRLSCAGREARNCSIAWKSPSAYRSVSAWSFPNANPIDTNGSTTTPLQATERSREGDGCILHLLCPSPITAFSKIIRVFCCSHEHALVSFEDTVRTDLCRLQESAYAACRA